MKNLFLITLLSVFLFACTPGVSPPISSEISTSKYTPGKIVWHDLASPDPESSARFYKSVFDWDAVPFGEGNDKVWVFRKGEKPVALMAYYKSENSTGEWIGAISVPDVEQASMTAKNNGGKILKKATNVDNRGVISFIQDPQGAHISLIKLTNGDPENKPAELNTFLGQELWSNEPSNSADFYTSVFGYTTSKANNAKIDYTIFKYGDQNCAGMLQNPASNVRSHWVPYIRVADVNATVEKAKSAGAQVLISPSPDIRNGSVALLLDPTGAPLAVQVYNP
ncbi:VOC family protein [Algoriphagus sp. SE2]|uniref:VOC family protein n=1 Tax=Algoriphagus sp. SE2 TaxID=3141536 RepID=UPI0031CD800D